MTVISILWSLYWAPVDFDHRIVPKLLIKISGGRYPNVISNVKEICVRQSHIWGYSISHIMCARFCCALFCCGYIINWCGFTGRSLLWRHNGGECVSNHQPRSCFAFWLKIHWWLLFPSPNYSSLVRVMAWSRTGYRPLHAALKTHDIDVYEHHKVIESKFQ